MKSEVKENKVDFSIIRYSQCWEDTEILLEALDINENDICLGIASAGDNIFSMLSKNPKKVIAIDLSLPQLYLLELKREIIRKFDYQEMILFFGVISRDNKKNTKKIRKEMYEEIRKNLQEKTKEYWDYNIEIIERGVNHAGKLEKFFRIFNHKILPFIHSKKTINKFFEKKSLEERKKFYDKKWENFRWKLTFRIFFSNLVIGKLGRDKEFFKYVEKDIATTMLSQIKYASTELNPHENPYINYFLTQNYRLDSLPYFLTEKNFRKIKSNLNKLEIVCDTLEEYLEKIDFKIDKFNLSDIFEYMSVENYAKLMEIIYKNCSDNALLAYWNLVVKRNSEMEELKNQFPKRFKRLKEIDQELHKRDKTFFYTDFVIERVIK